LAALAQRFVAAGSKVIFAKIKAGDLEVSFGTAETRRLASRAELDDYFLQMNKAD
jgi:hypothetical protein